MDPENDLKIPESLTLELKAQDRGAPLITARVDRALAEKAAAQFSARRSVARRPRPVWYAAAAAVAVIALLFLEPQRPTLNERSAAYADIDGSGQVDIADVLSLARRDNPLSQAELDAFASQVVALSSAGESS